jgi:hypothetical protein
MNMTIEQITAAYPNVAKLESQAGRELLSAVMGQLSALAAENARQQTHGEALAVDNAALREVVERMINQFAMSGISPEEKSINPAKSLMFDANSALFMPATDAFLAEVRAQGVEKLSDLAGNECQRYKSVGDRAGVRKWKSIVILCTDFAAQLRQGAAL